MLVMGNYIGKTLSARLSLWVVAFVTMMFIVVMWVVLWFAKQTVKDETTQKAQATLESAVLQIDNILHTVETAASNMLWNVEHHLDDPGQMQTFCRRLLETNSTIKSCAIAFEPDYYPEVGRFYMASCLREGDSIIRKELGVGKLYTEQDWYVMPMLEKKAGWAEPTTESRQGGQPIISYSIPFFDRSRRQQRPVGVLSVDISLDWLSRTIQNTRPFPNTYCALLSHRGLYIIHPDSAMLLPGSVMRQLEEQHNEDAFRLAKAMLAGESGSMAVNINGQDSYVFFKPFKHAGWSVEIVCPENEIFASYHRLIRLAVVLTVIGLLVLLAFCFLYIRRLLMPLVKLNGSALRMTEGHYDEPIAATNRQDEVGQMQRAFAEMQRSLASHLNEIEVRKKNLDNQSIALRSAYEHVQEADHAKNAFLESATDQMAHPLDAINHIVANVREQHEHLEHAEIVSLTELMAAHTKTVTRLLDGMIAVSAGSKAADTPQL